jgi:hypothetical protein
MHEYISSWCFEMFHSDRLSLLKNILTKALNKFTQNFGGLHFVFKIYSFIISEYQSLQQSINAFLQPFW